MMTIPAVVPPLPREWTWKRNVPPAAAFGWLSAGWRDFTIQPAAMAGIRNRIERHSDGDGAQAAREIEQVIGERECHRRP